MAEFIAEIDWTDPLEDERAAIDALKRALGHLGAQIPPMQVLTTEPPYFGGSEQFLELETILIKHGGMWTQGDEDDLFRVEVP